MSTDNGDGSDHPKTNLEHERTNVVKLLKDQINTVVQIASENNKLFKNLIFEGNAVAEKFSQFKIWRGRYSNNSPNMEHFIMAFRDVDQQIQEITKMFNTFDGKLVENAPTLSEYCRYMVVHYRWLQTNLEFAKTAKSLMELANVQIPKELMKSFPDPKLEVFVEEWKRMQLDQKLTKCFSQMDCLIKYIGSNGAM